MLKLLLEHGADPNARADDGATPLLVWARGQRSPTTLELLLEHGADAGAADDAGRTPLFELARNLVTMECRYGDQQWFSELPDIRAETMASVRALEKHGAAADVIVATMLGAGKRVSHLLEQIPAVAVEPGQGGITPLYAAAWVGDVDMARAFMERGADPTARSAGGATALHAAALSESIEIAKMLLDHGADIDARTDKGFTPLMLAVWSDDLVFEPQSGYVFRTRDPTPFIKFLVGQGADVNASGPLETTPLHMAASVRPNKVIAALLECGADPNALDHWRNTPLHRLLNSGWEARDARYAEGAKMLIGAGAKLGVRNASGETPLNIAMRRGFSRTIAVLQATRADRRP